MTLATHEIAGGLVAAAVAPTTALRWTAQLTEAGLLERVEDPRQGLGEKNGAFLSEVHDGTSGESDAAAAGMVRRVAWISADK